jgi:tRNA(Ile)-lysidine synthase
MDKFSRNLITEWRKLKLPFEGGTFVVAVSGGADSLSLMLALADLRKRGKLNLRFVIAHFNHNLRGAESDQDAGLVRNLTTKYDFEFICKTQNPEIKIQNQTGNLEQNARAARYAFLTGTAKNLRAYGVLTAHTINDQAETFLINLIRGSGLDGLSGMKAVRDLEFKIQDSRFEDKYKTQDSEFEDKFKIENLEFGEESKIQNPKSKIKLIRPLLNWAKREDTENFCHLNDCEFRYDAMNEDLAFSRVRIRKVLLPLLKDFNPKIVETLAKTAESLRRDALSLQSAFENNQQKADLEIHESNEQKNSSETLALKDLRDVFPAMRQTVLREWLRENRGNTRRLELKHIEAVENLIFSRKSGKVVELPNGEIVLKENGKLYFKKTKVDK